MTVTPVTLWCLHSIIFGYKFASKTRFYSPIFFGLKSPLKTTSPYQTKMRAVFELTSVILILFSLLYTAVGMSDFAYQFLNVTNTSLFSLFFLKNFWKFRIPLQIDKINILMSALIRLQRLIWKKT